MAEGLRPQSSVKRRGNRITSLGSSSSARANTLGRGDDNVQCKSVPVRSESETGAGERTDSGTDR